MVHCCLACHCILAAGHCHHLAILESSSISALRAEIIVSKAKFKGVIYSSLHKETEPINVIKKIKIVLFFVQLLVHLLDSEGSENCLSLENI